MEDVAVAASTHSDGVVLTGVNWCVAAGDFWAVRGGQHSGKTTVLELAAGLRQPTRGVCRVFGSCLAERTGHDDLETRRRVGVVFDGGGRLFPRLSLVDNIRLPLRYHAGETGVPDEAWADELVGLLDLTGIADLLPARVSPGRRQRAALARALALRPELLLLDNPLGNIDPDERAWWIRELNALVDGSSRIASGRVTVITTVGDHRDLRDIAAREARLLNRSLITSPPPAATSPA